MDSKNSHGGFYRKSEYLRFSSAIIIQNLTNRLRKLPLSIGIYPKFNQAFGLGQNSIKDIKRIKARYFEKSKIV
jgi:hypothetical protein